MKHGVVVLLVAVLLLTFAAAASAQTETEKLREQVKQLQDQLQDVLSRLQKVEADEAKPAAPAAPAAPKWSDKLKIGGYFQARYEDRRQMLTGTSPVTSTEAIDEFLVRRMYLGFFANPNERTSGAVLLRHLHNRSIDIEAMYVNYKFAKQWEVEFGRVYNKFGWDAWESSSRRLPFDRFSGLEGYGPGGVRGLYFQGPTDHGIYLTRKPRAGSSDWEPVVHAGVLNGNFISGDTNNDKTVEVDLRWNRPVGQFGISWLNGKYDDATVTQDREMLDLWFHSDPKPWGFQTELIDGKLFGSDVRGGYGQLARLVGDGTAFLRYETFDPTRGLDGDSMKAWRLGYAYQMDSCNELTLEFMDAERAGVQVGQVGFQWQMGF